MSLKAIGASAIDAIVKKRTALAYPLYTFARRVQKAYDNQDVSMDTNGENWLQDRMNSMAPIVAIDVGANRGEWSEGLLQQVKDCRITAYEPAPETYAGLKENITDDRVEIENLAVSDTAGNLTFHMAENTYVSSLYDVSRFSADVKTTKIEVKGVRGDDELSRKKIDHVHILKVDAEGHDANVLRSFSQSIAAGKIDLIQFEYNYYTLAGGESLRSFFDLLDKTHLVCRLLPAGLEAVGYHVTMDDFGQSNWVAVRYGLIDAEFVKTFNLSAARGVARGALQNSLSDQPTVARLLGL